MLHCRCSSAESVKTFFRSRGIRSRDCCFVVTLSAMIA